MAYCPPQYAPHYYYPTPVSNKTSYYEDNHDSLACNQMPQYISYMNPTMPQEVYVVPVHVPPSEDPFARPHEDDHDEVMSCDSIPVTCNDQVCNDQVCDPICNDHVCNDPICDPICDEVCDPICDEVCDTDEVCDNTDETCECDTTPKDTFILRVPRHKRPKLVINDTNHGHMGRHLHIDQYGNILSHTNTYS